MARGPYVLLLFMALSFNASGFYWCAQQKAPVTAALHAVFVIAAIAQILKIARGPA